jgi:hypothetical protein
MSNKREAGLAVCGCDGKQYPTACDAERAVVSILTIGPCTT